MTYEEFQDYFYSYITSMREYYNPYFDSSNTQESSNLYLSKIDTGFFRRLL